MFGNSKAVALIAIITIILLLMILVGAGMSFTYNNFYLASHVLDNTKAFYLAEAGIQRAMYRIKNSPPAVYPDSEDWSFVVGKTVTIIIDEPVPGNYTVTSTCNYNSSTNKSIRAEINSTTQLLKWEQLN